MMELPKETAAECARINSILKRYGRILKIDLRAGINYFTPTMVHTETFGVVRPIVLLAEDTKKNNKKQLASLIKTKLIIALQEMVEFQQSTIKKLEGLK
jgi:hypothetical protein